MVHALVYLIFGLVSLAWLRFELKKKFSLRTNVKWLWAAVGFGLLGTVLDLTFGGISGNFLLHAIGGGMASVCLYYYLTKPFKYQPNWRLELASLFVFVCALGVLNEIGEYFIELGFNILMSVDTHDTWRDFIANTSGAVTLWITLKAIRLTK